MSLNWDRFDNALSELWRFFGPPILNAILFSILFGGWIVERIVVLSSSIAGTASETYARYSEAFRAIQAGGNATPEQITSLDDLSKSLTFTIENLNTALTRFSDAVSDDKASGIVNAVLKIIETAGSSMFYLFILLAILVFLLDVAVKFVGSVIPLYFGTNDLSIVSHQSIVSLNGPATLGSTPAQRYNRWVQAKAYLDEASGFQDYKSVRDGTKAQITGIRENLKYTKFYFVTFVLSFLVADSFAEALMFLGLCFGAAMVFWLSWRRKLVLSLELVRNDFEAYWASQGTALNPPTKLDIGHNDMNDCVPVLVYFQRIWSDSLILRLWTKLKAWLDHVPPR